MGERQRVAGNRLFLEIDHAADVHHPGGGKRAPYLVDKSPARPFPALPAGQNGLADGDMIAVVIEHRGQEQPIRAILP